MIKLWSKTVFIICYIFGFFLLFVTILRIIYDFNIYILFPDTLALLCLSYAIFSPKLIIKDRILKISYGFSLKSIPLKDIYSIIIFQGFPLGKGGYTNIFRIHLRNNKEFKVTFHTFSSCNKKYEELKNITQSNAVQFKFKKL